MDVLATTLRAAQLYAHAAHHGISGPTFLSDHEFLGEVYSALEDAFDKVVERSIALDEPMDLAKINVDAASDASRFADPLTFSTAAVLAVVLAYERRICEEVDLVNAGATIGTQNLLAQIADDSEMRQYKISRRLK